MSNRLDPSYVYSCLVSDRVDINIGYSVIYEYYFPSIKSLFLSKGISIEEIKDIFQEVIIALYENIQLKKFQFNESLEPYLKKLSLNIWLTRQRKWQREIICEPHELEELLSQIDHPQEELYSECLNNLMSILSKEEKEIISMFYLQGLKMDKIAEKLGYKNGQVVRNKKCICLKKMRATLKQNDQLTIARRLD